MRVRCERQSDAQGVPAFGPPASLQLAAVHRDSLAHPDQPVPGASATAGAWPVVRDLDLELIRCVPEHDSGMRRPGVGEGIGQRLLHDPEGREVHARWQISGLTLDGQLDRQAGSLHLIDKGAELTEAGLGRERQRLVATSEHADQASHLVERLLARPFDDLERVTGVSRLGVEHVPAAARLDDHDADRVRDDVVELARNPRPLLHDRGCRPRLLLLELAVVQAPLPDRATGDPWGAHDEREEDDGVGGNASFARHKDQGVDAEGHGTSEKRPAAARVRRRAVDGEQQEREHA